MRSYNLQGKIKTVIFSVLLFLLVIGAVIFTWHRPLRRYERSFDSMGTKAMVVVYAPDAVQAQAAFETVFLAFAEVSNACNRFSSDSELGKLNLTAFDQDVVCSPLLWSVLRKARTGYAESGGLFDVSMKPLMDVWGFRPNVTGEAVSAPDGEAIRKACSAVGLDKVQFNEEAHSVRFPRPGMGLDLGGVAKGSALDLAATRLKQGGFKRALINLGGNIRSIGTPPGKKGFLIAVKDLNDTQKTLFRHDLKDAAVSTSGDYERFIFSEGRRRGHIVNPKTGEPAPGGVAVTVFSPSAADADMMSTAVFLGGEALAEKYVAQYPDTVIYMYDGKNIRRYPDGK